LGLSPGQLTGAVFLLSLLVFLGAVLLSGIAIARRLKREKELRSIDHSRDRVQAILKSMSQGMVEYQAGLILLREELQNGTRRTVERFLFESASPPAPLPLLQRLAEDLEFVPRWQRHIEGPSRHHWLSFRFYRLRNRLHVLGFLARARDADCLGRIRHRGSWRLLLKALDDPSRDVRAVALRSLAIIREPQSFPLLVERLRASALSSSPSFSVREIKAALMSFPIELAQHLLPFLQDSNSRLRLLGTEVLREMMLARSTPLSAPSFSAGVLGEELDGCIFAILPRDEDPDVRAGAADLLACFASEERAKREIVRLMEDREWFVRLHAVRAAGEQRGWLPSLVVRLTDSHWRVREAAAHAILSWGPEGLQHLVALFLDTQDGYAREQIAEELATSGAAAEMAARYGQPGYEREMRVMDSIAVLNRARFPALALAKAASSGI
jgi:HEAT repeat protein